MEPLVSIIIPLYNRAEIICETINSLLEQRYTNWEALIVDDGSDDRSLEILNEIAKNESRLKLYNRHRDPKGAPTCRNIGMENANGDYLIFLDSDDVLGFWCLESRVAYMINNDHLDFAVFNVLLFNKVPGDSNILWNIIKEREDLKRFLSSDVPWQTSSPIWKSTFVKKIKWDEEALSWQDWDFHIRILNSTECRYAKVDILPDIFIRRGQVNRISFNNRTRERIISLERLFLKIAKELEGVDSEKGYKKLLAGEFFVFAENIILSKVDINPTFFFKHVNKLHLINNSLYRFVNVYLCLLDFFVKFNIPLIRGIIYRGVRVFLPSYLARKNITFSKVSMTNDEYQRLKKILSSGCYD